ncbi:MAG: hypothetical protein KAW47_08525, partial [Thermoplasmatales archaeon]|nr:hypothetical protein [Thermoplasmatales archaeon]
MNEWYYTELTEASFKELITLTKWINKQYGYFPVVIGGWAVYSYVQSLGSRDIDIVFPTRESKEKVLLPYYSAMGYKEEGLFSKSFYKEIRTQKGVEKVMLDACSLSDKNILHEDKNIEIPWRLTVKHYKEWNIQQKGVTLQVPQIE